MHGASVALLNGQPKLKWPEIEKSIENLTWQWTNTNRSHIHTRTHAHTLYNLRTHAKVQTRSNDSCV